MANGYSEKILIQLEANTKGIQSGFEKLDATLEKLTASITKLNEVAFANMEKRAKRTSTRVKADVKEALDPISAEDFSKAIDKSFTKISQSALLFSRGMRAIGNVIPAEEIKGLTQIATHLTNTLRGAVYIIVNFSKGVETLAEISKVTGKSIAALAGISLSNFVDSIKTFTDLLQGKAKSAGFLGELGKETEEPLSNLKTNLINLSGVLTTKFYASIVGAKESIKLLNKTLSEGKGGVRAYINSLFMSDEKNLNWVRKLRQDFIEIGKELKNLGIEIKNTLLNPKLIAFIDGGFAGGLGLITKGVVALDNAIKNLKVSNLTGFATSIKGFLDGLKESFPQTIEAFGNLKEALTGLGGTLSQPFVSLGEGIKGILSSASAPLQGILSTGVLASVATAIGGVTVAFFGLKNAFAQLANLDMLSSFNSIMGSAQEAEAFLIKMNQASLGTVNTVNVIKSTNLALTEVSDTLRGELIDALPKLLEVATIQARATGDSVDHLFNSLVTGIKRGSSLLIDNTGIVIKIGEANKTLADSLGKTVEALTAEEKQLATLNAVMQASDNIIGKLGGSTATTNQLVQKMKVEWQNFGLLAGKAFEPLINAVMVIISPLNTIIVLIAQNLLPVFQLFSQSVSMVVNTLMMGLQPMIDVLVTDLQRLFGAQNNIAMNIMAFLVPAFDVLGKAFYVMGTVGGILIQTFIRLIEFVSIYSFELLKGVAGVFGFADSLTYATGGLSSFEQGMANFNMGFEVTIAFLGRLQYEIDSFISNSLTGIANWTGMVVGIFEGMAKESLRVISTMLFDISQIMMGNSPPPKGALSTIDRGAENVFQAWIDGFTGASMQPIHNMVGGISDIVSNVSSSITSFKFIDDVFDTIDNRLKALQEQYNNFKKVVDNSFELLNNKQNDLIKYLNMGDQSVLSTIRALDVQKESANELLNIRREQYLLSENELLVMQSQLGMQAAIANVEDNLYSGGSDTSERKGKEEKRKLSEFTKEQIKEALYQAKGSTSTAADILNVESGELANMVRLDDELFRYQKEVQEYVRDEFGTGGTGGEVEQRTLRRFNPYGLTPEQARQRYIDSTLADMEDIDVGGNENYIRDQRISQRGIDYQNELIQRRRTNRNLNVSDPNFVGGVIPLPEAPSLGSRVGDAFQAGRGTGLDFFTPKPSVTLNPQVTSLNAFERSVQKSSLGKDLSKFTRVIQEIEEAFNQLKDTAKIALDAIGLALQPITNFFTDIVTSIDLFIQKLEEIKVPDWLGAIIGNPSGASYMQQGTPEAMPASNPMGATKGAGMNGGQKAQQTIFDQLSDSIDNLILTLPTKLTLINGLFVTLFELPMQQLISRMFGLTSPTSILYIFNKVMLTDIPNVLQTFISTKWVLFKEQMVQTFVDLESLLSQVILYPIIRILNSILSGFQSTMESLAEGLNALIAFYNSLPPSIRGSSEQLQEFSIDKLKFKLIDVPTFAKGGVGSGMISVGERGQEYVSGSKLAVFPNSYVTATNHLARQLAMVNSTIRGNQQYNNSTTSNVDRSLTANIYTSRFDGLSLQQLQTIRG